MNPLFADLLKQYLRPLLLEAVKAVLAKLAGQGGQNPASPGGVLKLTTEVGDDEVRRAINDYLDS